jgi:hypothetical protein
MDYPHCRLHSKDFLPSSASASAAADARENPQYTLDGQMLIGYSG